MYGNDDAKTLQIVRDLVFSDGVIDKLSLSFQYISGPFPNREFFADVSRTLLDGKKISANHIYMDSPNSVDFKLERPCTVCNIPDDHSIWGLVEKLE